MAMPDTQIGGTGGAFPATSWSVVARLRDRGSAERRRLLDRLIADYWKPVYSLIRHSWAKTNEDAKDLTQEFFVVEVVEGTLLDHFDPERGNFRAFLKGALANFMRRTARDAGRLKRGGDQRALSLEMEERELGEVLPDARALTPEQVFDRTWKRIVLARAVALLEQRLRARGQESSFEAFRRYELEPEGKDVSYESVGRAVGMSSDSVKNALTRAREEFASAVSDVVAEYVGEGGDLSAELDHLFEP
jgi:RNA polymerase sigma factor (sigma-70 family)